MPYDLIIDGALQLGGLGLRILDALIGDEETPEEQREKAAVARVRHAETMARNAANVERAKAELAAGGEG